MTTVHRRRDENRLREADRRLRPLDLRARAHRRQQRQHQRAPRRRLAADARPTPASAGSIRRASPSSTGTARSISGDPPSKEAFLHRAMYEERSGAGAIVHLHSTHSAAVSCMDGLDRADCMPPLTAYYVMKIGRLPLIPYYRPGDPALGEAIRGLAAQAQRGAAGQPRPGGLRHHARSRGLRDRGTGGNRQAVPAAAQCADPAVERARRSTS